MPDAVRLRTPKDVIEVPGRETRSRSWSGNSPPTSSLSNTGRSANSYETCVWTSDAGARRSLTSAAAACRSLAGRFRASFRVRFSRSRNGPDRTSIICDQRRETRSNSVSCSRRRCDRKPRDPGHPGGRQQSLGWRRRTGLVLFRLSEVALAPRPSKPKDRRSTRRSSRVRSRREYERGYCMRTCRARTTHASDPASFPERECRVSSIHRSVVGPEVERNLRLCNRTNRAAAEMHA